MTADHSNRKIEPLTPEDNALRGPYRHIFLSPHLDDAALSCGGSIGYHGRSARPLVVTVCAGDPLGGAPRGSHARHLHELWGCRDDAVKVRRAEDTAAMEILSADKMHLALADCIYRCDPLSGEPYYDSEAQVFGAPVDQEGWMPAALAEFLDSRFGGGTPPPTAHVPLAIGGHVDHVLCHRSGRLLESRGWTAVYYEDFPYCDPDSPDDWGLTPRLIFFSEDELRRKVDAVLAYQSQLQAVFGPGQDIESLIRTHALRVGSGRLAELALAAP